MNTIPAPNLHTLPVEGEADLVSIEGVTMTSIDKNLTEDIMH